MSVMYALSSKKRFYNRFSVLYEVGSVAEEVVKHHPLSVVNLLRDIWRL